MGEKALDLILGVIAVVVIFGVFGALALQVAR
jgi:hypothetical protein